MDITICTSENCPYKCKCARQVIEDINEIYQSYCNFEYECCESDGFSFFIPTQEQQL